MSLQVVLLLEQLIEPGDEAGHSAHHLVSHASKRACLLGVEN
jgi:hypothetical protein